MDHPVEVPNLGDYKYIERQNRKRAWKARCLPIEQLRNIDVVEGQSQSPLHSSHPAYAQDCLRLSISSTRQGYGWPKNFAAGDSICPIWVSEGSGFHSSTTAATYSHAPKQTINKAKKRDRIQEDIDWLIWKLELEISRQSYYSA